MSNLKAYQGYSKYIKQFGGPDVVTDVMTHYKGRYFLTAVVFLGAGLIIGNSDRILNLIKQYTFKQGKFIEYKDSLEDYIENMIDNNDFLSLDFQDFEPLDDIIYKKSFIYKGNLNHLELSREVKNNTKRIIIKVVNHSKSTVHTIQELLNDLKQKFEHDIEFILGYKNDDSISDMVCHMICSMSTIVPNVV
ncbi:hypothetical protein JV173_03630 [Acholeplasma equirhinis]|uniref:hypothetical protein n=1 Tax=Acholeplasma equirhinis TaxID=555393 RepID=UPI00197A7230|nr:hypothetical protein [Acholeplasma equirhinis]MBN3490600.1 hypothetical protein [Acholeplasma equirhinis]